MKILSSKRIDHMYYDPALVIYGNDESSIKEAMWRIAGRIPQLSRGQISDILNEYYPFISEVHYIIGV